MYSFDDTPAKIFLQQLWLLKIDWFNTLPQAAAQEWHKLASDLHLLENLKIPHPVLVAKTSQIFIHGYADAFESTYDILVPLPLAFYAVSQELAH